MANRGHLTIGEWIQRITSEKIADAEAFAKKYPDPVLIANEQDTAGSSSGEGVNPADSGGPTEMLDAAKIKSGALASREARVWTVARKQGSGEIVVGRSRECDVWVDDSRVSKKHAAFEPSKKGEIVLHDLGSTNGTFVNDRRLDKGEKAKVLSHDQVRFGRAMKMHFMDAPGFWDYVAILRKFGM
jgi:pSer/pThr/pTyr-binding forkhead associated (FHA) protein